MDRCYGKTDRNYGKTGPSLSLLHPPQAPLGYRQHMGNEEKLGVVALPGPHDGNYSALNEPGRDGLGNEPAVVVRQNMVPGHDSRSGFTFTPGGGTHWLITVGWVEGWR